MGRSHGLDVCANRQLILEVPWTSRMQELCLALQEKSTGKQNSLLSDLAGTPSFQQEAFGFRRSGWRLRLSTRSR